MNFRPATPHDCFDLGRIMYVAALGDAATSGYDYSLGGSREHQERVLAALAAVKAESWFHYTHFDVAELDGKVVAAVAGFDRGTADECIPQALREIGWSNAEIDILSARLEPVMRCFPAEPEPGWTIEHVGCVPEYRRRGLTRKVLERALARGREAGYAAAHLDVFASNRAAVVLYESLGFRAVAEFGDSTFQQLLARGPMWRMEVPLA